MSEGEAVWDDARIREAFIDDGGQSEYYDPINGAREQRRIAGEIFDRWLAARDAAPVTVTDDMVERATQAAFMAGACIYANKTMIERWIRPALVAALTPKDET